MAEYPNKITDQLDWAQTHIGNFTAHAVAIGITAADATATLDAGGRTVTLESPSASPPPTPPRSRA